MHAPRLPFLISRALLLTALGGLTSCGSLETAAPTVASVASPSQSSYTHLLAGREIYIGKCTKCHSAEPVRGHSLADWKGEIMPEMSKKAKLSPGEEADVLAYITAASQSPIAPKPQS
jgi:uncharacterized membrane protein